MVKLARRLWDEEIAPVVAGVDPTLAFIAILGTAALVNKRYLGAPEILVSADGRWLALAGWLLALAFAAVVVRRRPGSTGHGAVAGMGGLALLGGVLFAALRLPRGMGIGNQLGTVFVMLLLVWIPLAMAIWCLPRAVEPRPWPRAATGLLLAGLLGAVVVLSHLGPLRLLMLDHRYDKINWCLLTFGWLYLGTRLPSLVLLGPSETNDGLGAGRWRFWLPWTAALLAFMVVLIVAYAGGQPAFTAYYPMFRGEWPGWNPSHNGWGFLVAFELAQGCYFLAWEYFFRGWMLFRLERLVGPSAILWQTVPFVLMHLGKPGPELHSSLIAGLVLGWLALRSRSFWPCFLLHWCAACTMDLVAVWHLVHTVR